MYNDPRFELHAKVLVCFGFYDTTQKLTTVCECLKEPVPAGVFTCLPAMTEEYCLYVT